MRSRRRILCEDGVATSDRPTELRRTAAAAAAAAIAMNLCAAAATAKAAAAAAADVTHRWFVVGVVRYASTGWRQGPNKSGCPSVGTTTTRGAIQPAQTPQTNAGGRLYAAAWRPPKLALRRPPAGPRWWRRRRRRRRRRQSVALLACSSPVVLRVHRSCDSLCVCSVLRSPRRRSLHNRGRAEEI